MCSDRIGDLHLIARKNEFSSLNEITYFPLFGIDMWEHAYYLSYMYDKQTWVDYFWLVIDWDLIEYWYDEYAGDGEAVPV